MNQEKTVNRTKEIVKVSLRGACGCCPHAMATLKEYVEANLRETVDPEITVERV